MVITVTLNPAMDKTLEIDKFSLGQVNRASSIRYDIGGKGINVSKVLKNFEIDSVCTGFLGGLWRERFMKELSNRNISQDFTIIDAETRTNTKIVDKFNEIYTDINEAGPEINLKSVEDFIIKFKNDCHSGDYVVLSGGAPKGIPMDIYKTLTLVAKEKGAIVILDAEGELLKEGIKGNPDIIKPNDKELSSMFSIPIDDEELLIEKAKELIHNGIGKVMISMGHKGAIYVTDSGVYFSPAVKVTVNSTVGAGDSMVAAIVYSLINKYDDKETLKFAVSSGTVSVTLKGTQACEIKNVKELLNKIEVNIRR